MSAQDEYRLLIVLLLVAVLIPALVMTYLLRPRPLSAIWRGGEVTGWASLVLLLTAGINAVMGAPKEALRRAGTVEGFVQVLILSLVALLGLIRVTQAMRHSLRNKAQKQGFTEYIERKGG